MKSLVVYSSQTGNTRKLAKAVFEALPGEKTLYPVDEAPDPSDYGFIAVGHPDDADIEVLNHQLAELFAGQYH